MTLSRLFDRRLIGRLALLFAVIQLMVVAGVLVGTPALRTDFLGTALLVLLGVIDLVLLAVFAGWIIRGSTGGPTQSLAADVHRIADGDYHHRVGDPGAVELKEVQKSVNRLADRLIADRRLLADNVRSLEDTNRELILLRDQMVHSARLASVGTLAAGIAHEVGNPLGAITGFVDVARTRAEKAGGDTELLDLIREEAYRIDRIVRGLLDYARPASADARPMPAPEVIATVRELLESQGKLGDVQVSWEVADGVDDEVQEPHRLVQVLVNLMINALDAVAETPEPRVSVVLRAEEGVVRRLPPRREDDPPGVNYMHRRRISDDEVGIDPVSRATRLIVIEVLDNGHGIRPEDVDHVFDPFFTTKEPGRGTGLGLSICARLVEGMGGHIEAKNRPEGGACFAIRLPGTAGPESTTVVTKD